MDRRNIGFAVFAAVAVVLWCATAYLVVGAHKSRSERVAVEAEVVGFKARTASRRRSNCPVLAFSHQGAMHQATDSACWAGKVAGSFPGKGETVRVLVNPDDPQDAMIDSFVRTYLYGMALGFVALVLTLCALLQRFVVRRGRR